MNRLPRCCAVVLCAGPLAVLCAGLLAVLNAGAQTAPATPRTPAASGAQNGVGSRPQGFKNLKVLPDNISHDELLTLMRQFSGDLGVECEFCHAARDPVTKRSDRASDANPVKDTARFMIEMTDDLNHKYLAEMPSRRYADPITCGTCHRGEKHPSIFVPPPRQEGNRPPGAPPAATPPGTLSPGPGAAAPRAN